MINIICNVFRIGLKLINEGSVIVKEILKRNIYTENYVYAHVYLQCIRSLKYFVIGFKVYSIECGAVVNFTNSLIYNVDLSMLNN